MTRDELLNIARRMDEETRDIIDREVEERLEILKEGDLTQEELEKMEEYLYASFVLQEYLNGEYEILEEERQELFDEMEEMYNNYADLLVRARIEEKVSKKKRMTLELMKIREQLMDRKQDYKDIKQMMKENRDKHNELNDLTNKDKMKDLSKGSKGLGGLPPKGVENKLDNLAKQVNELTTNTQNHYDQDLGLGYRLSSRSEYSNNFQENTGSTNSANTTSSDNSEELPLGEPPRNRRACSQYSKGK